MTRASLPATSPRDAVVSGAIFCRAWSEWCNLLPRVPAAHKDTSRRYDVSDHDVRTNRFDVSDHNVRTNRFHDSLGSLLVGIAGTASSTACAGIVCELGEVRIVQLRREEALLEKTMLL